MDTIKEPFDRRWIQKMWCIYTMEYYSATRKDGILPFVTTWTDLDKIMLS